MYSIQVFLSPNFTAMVTAHGKNQSIPAPIQDNTVPGMRLWQRRPDSGPPHIRLRQTGQGKRKANSTHFDRRRLASAET
jgi:hypothetical protein